MRSVASAAAVSCNNEKKFGVMIDPAVFSSYSSRRSTSAEVAPSKRLSSSVFFSSGSSERIRVTSSTGIMRKTPATIEGSVSSMNSPISVLFRSRRTSPIRFSSTRILKRLLFDSARRRGNQRAMSAECVFAMIFRRFGKARR